MNRRDFLISVVSTAVSLIVPKQKGASGQERVLTWKEELRRTRPERLVAFERRNRDQWRRWYRFAREKWILASRNVDRLNGRVAELEEEIYWRNRNFQRQEKEIRWLRKDTHNSRWCLQQWEKTADLQAGQMRSANALLKQRVKELERENRLCKYDCHQTRLMLDSWATMNLSLTKEKRDLEVQLLARETTERK